MRQVYICIFALTLWVSNGNAQAQTDLFSRVKINLDAEHTLGGLARLGMEVDHGQLERDVSFTGEFSASELAQMTQAGFTFDVLVADLKTYYHSQVGQTAAAAAVVRMEGECQTSIFDKQYPTPENYAPGSYAGYFRYQEMLDILDAMHNMYPNLISAREPVSNTLLTHEGRPIWYVRLSDNPDQNEAEPEMLYTAVHHAREPNSMSQMIFYLWYMLEHYSAGDPEAVYLIENTEMYFVPCLNPDGYIFNETTDPNGGGMFRKNRRDNGDGTFGVDLNRNYSYSWGIDDQGSSPTTSSETYRGTAPFSEPETQMIRDFVNEHEFKIALNYHTYSNLLLHPWGYASTNTPDHDQFEAIGNNAIRHNAYKAGGTGAILYLANGGSDDWMYGDESEHEKVFAYTPEVGPAYWGFWPPAEAIDMLNKAAMTQNLTAAHAVHPYAELSTDQTSVIENLVGSIPFKVRRIGLVDGPVTVSLEALTSNIVATSEPEVFNLSVLQTAISSASFELDSFTDFGEQVVFGLHMSNGTYTWHDTLRLVYGTQNVLIDINCNSTGPWATDGWGVSTANPYSPTGAITDSPNGVYDNDAQTTIITSLPVNLTGVSKVFLEYRARWELEGDRDYVQVNCIANGSTTPLCGRYTAAADGNFQPLGEPVYDGSQIDWVLERIDISEFIPSGVRIQFALTTDGNNKKDGFSFDDLRIISVVDSIISAVNVVATTSPLSIHPNPATDILQINLTELIPNGVLTITDIVGRELKRIALTTTSHTIKVSDFSTGLYICYLRDAKGGIIATQKVVIE